MILRFSAAVVLCIVGMAVQADVVRMANGDILRGKVDAIAGGKLTLETEYAGTLAIDMEHVSQVDAEEALSVRLDSGDTLTGEVVTSGERQVIVVDGEPRPLALASVTRMSRDLRAVNREGAGLTARTDLGANVSRGNSDTDTYSARGDATWDLGKQRHLWNLAWDYEEAESEKTKDKLDIDYGYNWFYREAWFLAANAEYFQDKLKDVDQRITLGLGLGHQFWENSLGALSAELGASWVHEESDGKSDDNPAARWALRYNRFFFGKKLELFHDHRILSIFDDDGRQVVNGTLGMRYTLTDRLDVNWRVDAHYETDPPPDSKELDTTFILGVGFRLL